MPIIYLNLKALGGRCGARVAARTGFFSGCASSCLPSSDAAGCCSPLRARVARARRACVASIFWLSPLSERLPITERKPRRGCTTFASETGIVSSSCSVSVDAVATVVSCCSVSPVTSTGLFCRAAIRLVLRFLLLDSSLMIYLLNAQTTAGQRYYHWTVPVEEETNRRDLPCLVIVLLLERLAAWLAGAMRRTRACTMVS